MLLYICSTLVILGISSSKATASILVSLRDCGVSLNTNNNFRKIDGTPRMSVYKTNPNSNDQKFDFLAVSGGFMIKNVTTGKCLNAHYLTDGRETNVRNCNSSDPDQIWNKIDKGSGYFLIRRNGTNLCLTADTPVGNSSIVALRNCAYGGANGTQDWIGSDNPNSPWFTGSTPTPAPAPTITYKTVSTTPLYEYWIVARKISSSNGYWSPTSYSEVGHAFTAIIRKNRVVIQKFSNGNLVSTSAPQDDGGWFRYHTYGFWPEGLKVDVCDNGQGSSDCNNVNDLLAGKSISQAGQAVRKQSISESRMNYIHSNLNYAGCSGYSGVALGGGWCNCVDYATRSWYLFAAQRSNEDFRPWSIDAKSPNGLVDQINRQNVNSGSDFIDNGLTWQ